MAHEPNYVVTVNLICGECKTEFPVNFEAGVPFSRLVYPWHAAARYACPMCGAGDTMTITMAQQTPASRN